MAGSHRPRSQGQLRSQPEALARVELLSPTRSALEGSGRFSSCPNLSLKPDTILKAGRPLEVGWPQDVPSDSGLATTTKLQNSLKMKYAKRLHSACYGADNEGCGPEVEAEAQNYLMNEENFADDVAHLTNAIEDLSKLIRFDHLQKSDARMLKLEAAKREKEAELRRTRKKEQMARDPSRKVPNADLSMRRRSQDIPLVPFHAPGCGTGNKDLPCVLLGSLAPRSQCRWLTSRRSSEAAKALGITRMPRSCYSCAGAGKST